MSKKIVPLIALLSFFAATFVYTISYAQDDPTGWSVGQRIPGVERSPHTRPHLIADNNRTIHFFNSQIVGNEMSIVYSKWTLENGWTVPVDILVSSRGEARLIGVHLDDDGLVHLVFFAGNDFGASIYYSRAHISQAGNATMWSEPILIGESAITPTAGALLGDGKGRMAVTYSGKLDGNGLYDVHSIDGGLTWSEPHTVFLTGSTALFPWSLSGFVSDSLVSHLVWSLVNVQGNGEAIYYSQFDLNSFVWLEPTILATAIQYEANTPTIIETYSNLLVVYHNGFPTTRWAQWSRNSGISWEAPQRISNRLEGSNGPASLVIDSAGMLHILFGNRRVGNSNIHGLWHSVWDGEGWTYPPVSVVSGIANQDSRPGGEAFDPWYARAVISQGNVLLVTWSNDPASGSNGIWFSYKELDAPELEIQQFPTQVVAPTEEHVATKTPPNETPTSAMTPTNSLNFPTTDTQPTQNMFNFVAIALIPSLVVVSGVVAFRLFRRNR